MAVEVCCDYCGEAIEGRWATIEVGGLNNPRSVERAVFQYHPEPTEDTYHACYERATRALRDMSRWAHEGEGSGMAWELHHLPRSVLAPNPAMTSTAPIRGTLAITEASLHPRSALALRRAGVRTLEEAAEQSEIGLLAIEGVAERSVDLLREALAQHELAFRPGPTAEELGARIRDLREAAGLTRREVADAIRTDGDDRLYENEVADWEAGRRVPTPRRLERLAKAFGQSVEQLTAAGEVA